MIRIAIIDDEVHMHDMIEGYVKEAVTVGERLEVAVFQNAEQFKDALKKDFRGEQPIPEYQGKA